MKIGVSSQNFKTITGHAGKGRRFIVYDVAGDGTVTEEDRLDLPKTMSIHETLESSPHPLDELDVLITGSAGDGFLRKMHDRGVEVVMTSASDPLLAVMSFAAGEVLPPAELDHDDHDHDHGHDHHQHAGGGGCCGGGGHHHHHEHSHSHAAAPQYYLSDEPAGGGCCGGGGHHHEPRPAPAPKRGGGGGCGCGH
jgi:predicted Fe-Mo cluster-binding NifX family protein